MRKNLNSCVSYQFDVNHGTVEWDAASNVILSAAKDLLVRCEKSRFFAALRMTLRGIPTLA